MKKFYSTLLVALIALNACSTKTELEMQTANHIARPAFMVERTIQAGQFTLQAWERMHQRGTEATIYIEGDGARWQKNTELPTSLPRANPTPENPVALHLASRDLSQNLGYLARPCQYIKDAENKGCNADYWQTKRFAPEIMEAYDAALSDISKRYDITKFNLVGYDGGANIAAVLAARRDDVISLRTVAGNLNPDFAADNYQAMPLAANSILAVDYGSALGNIPQHHFIGAADEIITPGIYHSYRQAIGLSECIHYSLVQDADHTNGWVEKWPDLLSLQPQCAIVHKDLSPLPPAGEFPGDYNKGMRGLSK